MLTARLNPVPAGGLRPVQPPRLLHAYRVRQPLFRTMNRDEMPRSGHPQGVPLRDTAARRLARRHINADGHQAPGCGIRGSPIERPRSATGRSTPAVGPRRRSWFGCRGRLGGACPRRHRVYLVACHQVADAALDDHSIIQRILQLAASSPALWAATAARVDSTTSQ
jgi:hypothetical protein